MKRILLNIFWGLSLIGALSSCSEDEHIIPSDTPSVFGFGKSTVSVKEGVETVEIEVVWSKFTQIPGEVTLTVAGTGNAKAEENIDYTISTKTLTFGADEYRKSFTITSAEGNDTYTGTKNFIITLASSNVANARLGAVGKSATCTVSIADIDHPLTALFGEATMRYISYYDNAEWTAPVNITPDPGDITIVWIATDFGVAGSYIKEAAEAPLKAEVVTTDENFILTIKLPHQLGSYWNGGNPLTMYGIIPDGDGITDVSGPFDWVGIGDKTTGDITFENGFYIEFEGLGGWEIALPGTVTISKP
jgi:hypothetical protein